VRLKRCCGSCLACAFLCLIDVVLLLLLLLLLLQALLSVRLRRC
jgi:hypothetical protein